MEQVLKIDTPKNTSDIVIFVHGFGVRWDSRGMFTDIKDSLPSTWGSVLFDFYKADGNDVYITNVEEQVSKLRETIDKVKKEYPDALVHIIAHSMGCVIASLASTEINGKVVFLAPPESFGSRIEEYFKSQPGAQTTASELVVPRKDNTTSHIPIDFFAKLRDLDPEQTLLDYSKLQKINLTQTTDDEVLGRTNYKKLQNNSAITIKIMPSDHNFTDNHRSELLNYISHILEKAYVVDEKDNIIDIKFRIDTTPQDRIRIVGIWVENSKQEVLIAQRSHGKRLDPGKWGPSAAGGWSTARAMKKRPKKKPAKNLV